jgi:hypothetical protein
MPSDFMTVNPALARGLAGKAALPLVVQYTERVATAARIMAPGTMKQHIRVTVLPGASPRGLVICDHPATTFVLYGTKKHVIRPRRGKFLVFTPKGGGKKVFARIVHHPGTKPNNFLLKALHSV